MTLPPILLAVALAGLAGCSGGASGAPVAAELVAGPPAAGPSCAQDPALRGLDCLGAGGTRYVVDQRHPAASDGNPGTVDRPWRTIHRATGPDVLRPGDAVVIRGGVYRESVRPRVGGTGPAARVTYAAWPGEAVVVTGADLAADGWTQTRDGDWRRAWSGPGLETYSDEHAFRRELVVAGGRVLRPVAERGRLAPGRFWAEGPDHAPAAVVVRLPGGATPSQAEVEIAHRTRLFWPEGPTPDPECGAAGTPGWLRVVGITFRHASNRAQWAAFCAGSSGGLVEDVAVEWTNGLGIDVTGRGHVFRQSRADLNGQMGWGGSCVGCLIEDGAAVGNNWRGHDPFWEAGGAKWTETSGTVVRRFYAAHNGGPGIWLDIDNVGNTVEGSLVVGNRVAGILLEYRTTETLVQHNVVAQTRWRSWSGAGILSQAASRNAYAHNTVVENQGTGLWLRLDPDRRAADGGNAVSDNVIVGNAAGGPEAREVSVEGLDPGHVRTTSFVGNAVGRLGAGTFRSSFYVYPAPSVSEAGFRGESVGVWERLTGARDTRLVGPGERTPSSGAPPPRVGASRPEPYRWAGADLGRVRAGGDWRSAPPAPWWPR